MKQTRFIKLLLIAHTAYQAPVKGSEDLCEGICKDGAEAPLPDQIVSGNTCSDWNAIVSGSLLGNECTSFQAVTGAACGCENPPNPPCNVCAHGYDWGGTVYYGDGTEESCENAIFLMSLSTESCKEYTEYVSQYCCLNDCRICHGGAYSSSNKVVYDNGVELSCKDLGVSATMITQYSEECKSVQGIAAEFCDCQSQEEKCSLCHDGSYPPFENAIIRNRSNIGCIDAFHSAPFFNADSEMCPILRAAGILYCGCDLKSEKCSLCGEGERVDENLRYEVIDIYEDTRLSCAEYESFLNALSPTSKQCLESKQFQAQCCGALAD